MLKHFIIHIRYAQANWIIVGLSCISLRDMVRLRNDCVKNGTVNKTEIPKGHGFEFMATLIQFAPWTPY